jgi:gluconolactonase
MLYSPRDAEAREVTRLPEALHHKGEPNDWVRITRPGMRLHSFLEGPAFGPDGALYLVDVPYGRIFRLSPDFARWEVALVYDGEPHGLAFAPDGRLIATDYRRGLVTVDLAKGSVAPLAERHNTEAFRGLSDLAIDPDGAIWFTDSGRTSLSDPTGRLFRLEPGKPPVCVLANIPYPNGVAFSADGAHVYVAATRANAVWRLLRKAPELGTPMVGLYVQLSGGLGPDGLSVAPTGELAVVHGQAGPVFVFDPLGQPRWRIRTPSGLWTTAARFGPDGRTLYIVEAQSGSVLAYEI